MFESSAQSSAASLASADAIHLQEMRRHSEEVVGSEGKFWRQIYSAPSPFSPKLTPEQEESKRMKRDAKSRRKREKDDDKVMMGTKISEGHANYILMYDMLTGIRIAVSHCVAKPHRELVPADFRAKYKLTFDIMGNELTPSSRYEFKFKDYAPWVFRNIREHFKIEAADYLVYFLFWRLVLNASGCAHGEIRIV
jgi:hypothetical protein